jgi:hypothetical protein
MTIRWREESRQEIGLKFNDPASRREWLFTGSTDRNAIIATAAAVIPAIDVVGGVPLFYDHHDIKEESTGAWRVKVEWRKNPTYWELSIDTTGGTGKILQSFATVRGYDCEGAGRALGLDPQQWLDAKLIPNFQRAIGVNGNNIEGVDVVIPKFDFSINYKLRLSTLSSLYLMTLYDLTGKVNDKDYTLAWKGQTLTFRRGDLRFLGAPAKMSSEDNLDITFRFSASKRIEVYQPNQIWFLGGDYLAGDLVEHLDDDGVPRVYRCLIGHTAVPGTEPPAADLWETANLTIGDSLPIEKRGWEYLWVRYEEALDRETNQMVRRPIAVYVEQVCRYGNLDLLGI